jgi:hypothetical protein
MGDNQNIADAGFGEVTGIVHGCEARWDARRSVCRQGRSLGSYRGIHRSLFSIMLLPRCDGLACIGHISAIASSSPHPCRMAGRLAGIITRQPGSSIRVRIASGLN